MKLRRKLEAWRAAGLLTADQAAGISKYEEEHAGGVRWVVWSIAAVGGLAIAAGVISVIAANWDDIPERVKLAVCGAMLLGSLWAAWRIDGRASNWPRDLFLFLHNGMVLATIALVAQVYHLSGHPWRAMALCAALATPAAVVAAHGLLTDVVIAFTTLALGLFLDEIQWLNHHFEEDFGAGYLAGALGLVCLIGSGWVQRVRAPAAAALQRWGIGLAGVTAVTAAVFWSERHYGYHDEPRALWPLFVFVAASLLHAGSEAFRKPPALRSRLVALALFVGLLAGPVLLDRTEDSTTRVFFGFALFCATCGAVAVCAAAAGSKLGTNLATLALAGRVLALYFELAKDLMTTGVGLIATGLVCLGIAYAWWRLRRVLPVAATPTQAEVA